MIKFGRRERAEHSERIRELQADREEIGTWRAPWPILTVGAAVLTAVAGWLLVVGYCVLGWISVPEINPSAVLGLGSQGWLLANGISFSLPGAQLSIMPLGLTLIICWVGFACLNAVAAHSHAPEPGQLGARVLKVAAVFAISYAMILGFVRSVTQGALAANSSIVGGLVLSVLLGLAAAVRSHGWRPPVDARWTAAALRSLAAGLAVLVVTGAVVLGVALWTGRERFAQIHESLEPAGLGTAMLLLGQLAWLPNFILWGGAWAIGAGIQLGVDTVITPAQTMVGMLPAIPVLGAVPPAGPVSRWLLFWVLSGAVAGAVAAFVAVRSALAIMRERGVALGIDLTAIIGAMVGIVVGLVFTVAQLPASGDLGAIRLIDLGARVGALLIMAPTSMGLAGMATGWLVGFLAARRGSPAPGPQTPVATEPVDEAEVPTTVVGE